MSDFNTAIYKLFDALRHGPEDPDAVIEEVKNTESDPQILEALDFEGDCYKFADKTDPYQAANKCFDETFYKFTKKKDENLQDIKSKTNSIEEKSSEIQKLNSGIFANYKPRSILGHEGGELQVNINNHMLKLWIAGKSDSGPFDEIGLIGLVYGRAGSLAVPIANNYVDFIFSIGGGFDAGLTAIMVIGALASVGGDKEFSLGGAVLSGAVLGSVVLLGTVQIDLSIGFRFFDAVVIKAGINPSCIGIISAAKSDNSTDAWLTGLGFFISLGFEGEID